MRTLWILLVAMALSLGGCKSSVEGQKQRYNAVRDRLDALATKLPQYKADIQAKLAEFAQAEKEAEAKGGDAAISAIRAVVDRMDSYEKNLNPATPAAAGSSGAKLNPSPPPAAPPTPPPATPAASGKSGFGGK